MADYVTKYADKRLEILEMRIAAIYRQAQKELGERFRDFMEEHREMDAEMRRQMDEGKITPYKYKKWLKQEVFTGEQWRKKQVAAAKVLTQADRQAAKIINEGTIDVFAEASNFTAYDIEQHVKGTNIDIGGAVSFDIYDQKTVTRLIAEQPKLLPRRIVDGVTANAWNQQVIANAVTQGIIQGESIPYLAKRIVRDTGVQSVKTATKYARTAMTGAQNAGRVERMEEAEEMGIEVKKEWMATNDSKTRDEHGELDGQQRKPDEPFEVNGKKIMFPGDPSCPHGELVWNCRCTMRYIYPKYAHIQKRVRQPYKEWKAEKERVKPHDN